MGLWRRVRWLFVFFALAGLILSPAAASLRAATNTTAAQDMPCADMPEMADQRPCCASPDCDQQGLGDIGDCITKCLLGAACTMNGQVGPSILVGQIIWPDGRLCGWCVVGDDAVSSHSLEPPAPPPRL